MTPMMSKLPQSVDTIAFDADDTLWVNEVFFAEAEKEFIALMSPYMDEKKAHDLLFQQEMKNLSDLGFGIKAFTISMIETAMTIVGDHLSRDLLQKIIAIGKDMLHKPVELMPDIVEVLQALKNQYDLIVLTKGDLLDQERKLEKSGLVEYFDHFQVMSDKKVENYRGVFSNLGLVPSQILMIGNSMKSDVLPLLELGAHAIHIPFHTVWKYEHVEEDCEHQNFQRIKSAKELLDICMA